MSVVTYPTVRMIGFQLMILVLIGHNLVVFNEMAWKPLVTYLWSSSFTACSRDIAVFSRLQEGSIFTVRLPLDARDAVPRSPASAGEPTALDPSAVAVAA